jgi:hypothetical protein
MHPDAGDGVAMPAGAQRGDLAFYDVGMVGKTKIVVAADLDVARTRCPALQGVASLPKVDFPAHVVIVDASTEEVRFPRDCGSSVLFWR